MSYFNTPAIKYEGPKSKNPFAFKYYNPEETVLGKTMKEQCRFAMSYWHTFTYMGNDPFGGATMYRPWDQTEDSIEKTKRPGGFPPSRSPAIRRYRCVFY